MALGLAQGTCSSSCDMLLDWWNKGSNGVGPGLLERLLGPLWASMAGSRGLPSQPVVLDAGCGGNAERIEAIGGAVLSAYEHAVGAGSLSGSISFYLTDVRDLRPQLERQGVDGFEQLAHRDLGSHPGPRQATLILLNTTTPGPLEDPRSAAGIRAWAGPRTVVVVTAHGDCEARGTLALLAELLAPHPEAEVSALVGAGPGRLVVECRGLGACRGGDCRGALGGGRG